MSYSLNKNKYLNDFELTSLESSLQKHLETDTRNCLLLLLAIKTGARATELLNIEKKDLDSQNGTIYIRGIKNSNSCEIPIPRPLFDRLSAYADTLTSERIFPISYSRLYAIWKIYGPRGKKLHSTRHTVALNCYKKTKDIHITKTLLRQKSINNTLIYLDYVYSQNELKQALGIK